MSLLILFNQLANDTFHTVSALLSQSYTAVATRNNNQPVELKQTDTTEFTAATNSTVMTSQREVKDKLASNQNISIIKSERNNTNARQN